MGKILEEIHEITVVGDGLMGHGISQVFAQKDYSVTLVDLNRTILERALSQIRSNLETFVEVGLQPKERGEKGLLNIWMSVDLTLKIPRWSPTVPVQLRP